jgi:hypothetical protein
MVTASESGFTLRVEKGDGRGQVHAFTGRSVRIGRKAPCELVLRVDSVSSHHATIRYEGSSFVLVDERSANGTFVNGDRVFSPTQLNDGDVVGLGPDVDLRYQAGLAGVAVRAGAPPKGKSESVTSGVVEMLRQRPALAAGLGVYLVAILVAAVYLSVGSTRSGPISRKGAEELVRRTGRFLADGPLERLESARGTCGHVETALAAGRRIQETDDEDPAVHFVAVTRYREALQSCGFASLREYKSAPDGGAPVLAELATAIEAAVDRTMTELRDALFASWRAERQGQRKEARRSYERVLVIVPEERAPSYRFALARLRALR